MYWIPFTVFGGLMLFGAWRVVDTRDLVRGVLWLAVVLAATAGAFVMLKADFVAALQILLYTGGVVTLILFGVMLTRRLTGSNVQIESAERGRAAAVAALTLGGLMLSIFASDLPATPFTDDALAGLAAQPGGLGGQIGALFLTRHMLAFEALSVLLLAAMIGAIVMARRKDP